MEMTASVICWLSRWHSAETKGNGGQTLSIRCAEKLNDYKKKTMEGILFQRNKGC